MGLLDVRESKLISLFILSRHYRLSTTSIYFYGANLLPEAETYGKIFLLILPVQFLLLFLDCFSIVAFVL